MKTKVSFICISLILVLLCACAPLSLSSKGGKGILLLQLPGSSEARSVAYDGHSFNFKIEISGSKGFSKVITSEGNDLISEELEVGMYTVTATAHYYFDTGYKNPVYKSQKTVEVLEDQETPVSLELQLITSDITFGKNLWNHVDESGGYDYNFCGTLEDLNLELSNPVGGSTLAFTITGTAVNEVHAFLNCEFIRFGLWDEDYHPITNNGMWVDAMPGDEVTMRFEILVPDDFSFAPDDIPGILIHYEPDVCDHAFTLRNCRIEQIYRQYIIKDVPLEELNSVYSEAGFFDKVPLEFGGKINGGFAGNIYYEINGKDGPLAVYHETFNTAESEGEFWTCWVLPLQKEVSIQNDHPTISISYNGKKKLSFIELMNGGSPTLFHPQEDIIWYTFHADHREAYLPYVNGRDFWIPRQDWWAQYFPDDMRQYEFLGWYENLEFTGTAYGNPSNNENDCLPASENNENRDFYAKYNMKFRFNEGWDAYDGHYWVNYYTDKSGGDCGFPQSASQGDYLGLKIKGTPSVNFKGVLFVELNEWLPDEGDHHLADNRIFLDIKEGIPFEICVPLELLKGITDESNPGISMYYNPPECTFDGELVLKDWEVSIDPDSTVSDCTFVIGAWEITKKMIQGYTSYLPVPIETPNPEDRNNAYLSYFQGKFPDSDVRLDNWTDSDNIIVTEITANSSGTKLNALCKLNMNRDEGVDEDGTPWHHYKSRIELPNLKENVSEGDQIALKLTGKMPVDLNGLVEFNLTGVGEGIWEGVSRYNRRMEVTAGGEFSTSVIFTVPENFDYYDDFLIEIAYWTLDYLTAPEYYIDETAIIIKRNPSQDEVVSFIYNANGQTYKESMLTDVYYILSHEDEFEQYTDGKIENIRNVEGWFDGNGNPAAYSYPIPQGPIADYQVWDYRPDFN